MAFTAAGTLLFLAIGIFLGYAQGGWTAAGARVLNPHLLPALALYLLWGLLQQFVFEFYLLGRLLYLFSPPVAVALTAVVFSAVHFPRFIVMAAVAIAAVVWASLYRRYRTLLPLAISHAILASTLHYWVFARDLWAVWIER
jgi:membrane protease YdiL (CAAX protease family)